MAPKDVELNGQPHAHTPRKELKEQSMKEQNRGGSRGTANNRRRRVKN